jgi:hypothetical protein
MTCQWVLFLIQPIHAEALNAGLLVSVHFIKSNNLKNFRDAQVSFVESHRLPAKIVPPFEFYQDAGTTSGGRARGQP